MSLIKFELKKEHVALIKGLKWDENVNRMFEIIDTESPFGGDSLTEDLGLIIFGLNKNFVMDALNEDGPIFSSDQVSAMFSFYEELPRALEVVTNTCSFELGHYKRKFNDLFWVKYEPKVKK